MTSYDEYGFEEEDLGNFDHEAIARVGKQLARRKRPQKIMTWDEFNDDDGCGWMDTNFEQTDLTDPGEYGIR